MHWKKFIVIILTSLLCLRAVGTTLAPKPAYADALEGCNGDIGCIIQRLFLVFTLTPSLILGTFPQPQAYCGDTHRGITGNPKPNDEYRQVGNDLDCGTRDTGKTVTANTNVSDSITIPVTRVGTYTQTISLDPREKLSGQNPGPGRSDASGSVCTGDKKDDISCYLDTYSYKAAMETLRLSLWRGDTATYKNLSRAGVLDKLQPYLCGDIPCDEDRRLTTLRAAARGWWYSVEVWHKLQKTICPFPGCDESKTLAQIRADKDVANDPFMGFIHAKCVADGSCGLDGNYKTDTVMSTYPTNVPGELPIYGIVYACMTGLAVDGVDMGQLCSVVVGPNYGMGQLARDGLLWLQMEKTGGTTLHPQAYTMQFCGKGCEWATGKYRGTFTGGSGSGAGGPVNGDRVGPELSYGDEEKNIINPLGYQGTFSVNFDITETPVNNSPGNLGYKVMRVNVTPKTTLAEIIPFTQALNAAKDSFPEGMIVIVGNEVNNLDAEWKIDSPSVDKLPQAAIDYALVFNEFAQLVDPRFRVAPAPPDMYNGVYIPGPWIDSFVQHIDCDNTDVLVANVFDNVTPILGGAPTDSWKYWENAVQSACRARNRKSDMKVVHFQGWGDNPNTKPSVAAQVDWLNTHQLPDGIESATTLVVDTCNGKDGKATNSWLAYIPGDPFVYKNTGEAVDPATCGEGLGSGPLRYFTTPKGPIFNVPPESVDEVGSTVEEEVLDVGVDAKRKTTITDPARIDEVPMKKISKYLLPYPLSQLCDTSAYEQQFPNEYTLAHSANAKVSDIKAQGDLPLGPSYSVEGTGTVTDPKQKTVTISASKPLKLTFSIHQEMEQFVRYAVQKSCGIANHFLSLDHAKALHTVDDTGVAPENWPVKETVKDCEGGDTDCAGFNDSYGGPNGGVNITMNECGTTQASLLPFGFCPKGANGLSASEEIMQFAKKAEAEKLAKTPWLQLASFETQAETAGLSAVISN